MTVGNFEATTLFFQVFQFSTHRKGRLVQLGEKVNSGNDNLTFSHCPYYWDVSQHMEKEKAQNGFEKAILCLNSFFPIKIKEKESVRLRNPRSRITFPLNLIYPPSQSMQFQFPVKLHNLKSLGLIIAQFHGKISQILRYGILTQK